MLAQSEPNRFLFFESTSPAVEKTRSAGTDVAGQIKCFIAASYKDGKLGFPSVSHHFIGSVPLSWTGRVINRFISMSISSDFPDDEPCELVCWETFLSNFSQRDPFYLKKCNS